MEEPADKPTDPAPGNRGRFVKGDPRLVEYGKRHTRNPDTGDVLDEWKLAQKRGGKTRGAQPDFLAGQSQRGRKGYQATLQRYGYEFVMRKIAASFRRRLTRPEQWTLRILTGAGLIEGEHFWCQHPVCLDFANNKWVIVDFLIRGSDADVDTWVVLEPGDPLFHGNPLVTIDHTNRQAIDQARADAITAAKGWPYLDFNARWIDDKATEHKARRRIRWACGRAGYAHDVLERIV